MSSVGFRLRKLTRLVVTFLLPALAAGTGYAAAHAANCWTADPGQGAFTITCGPHYHEVPFPINNGGAPNAYNFQTRIQIHQSAYGEFAWVEIRLMNGHDNNNGSSKFGHTYIINSGGGGGIVFEDTQWNCVPVGSVSNSGQLLWIGNPSTQGYWEQRSTTGGDCARPALITADYVVANAY